MSGGRTRPLSRLPSTLGSRLHSFAGHEALVRKVHMQALIHRLSVVAGRTWDGGRCYLVLRSVTIGKVTAKACCTH